MVVKINKINKNRVFPLLTKTTSCKDDNEDEDDDLNTLSLKFSNDPNKI